MSRAVGDERRAHPRDAWAGRLEGAGQSLSRRLLTTFVAYLLLLVLAGGVGIAGSVAVGAKRADELRQERLREGGTAMMLAMVSAESSIRGYRLTGDRAFLAPYDAALLQFPRVARRTLTFADTADERDLIRAQADLGRYWFTDLAAPIVATDGQSRPTPAQARVFKEVSSRFRALNTSLDVLAERRVVAADAAAERAETAALLLSAVALALSLAAAMVVHRRLRRALVDPLEAMVATLGRLTAGRHDARADADAGPSEVRLVAASLNALAGESDRLRRAQGTAERYQRLAVDVSRAIRDEIVDGDPIIEALIRLGTELGADRVYVREIDAEDRTQLERQWMRPPLAPLPPTTGDADYDHEAAERLRTIYAAMSRWVSEDTSVVVDGEQLTASFVQRTGARAAVAVPVGAGHETLGMLAVVQTTGPRRWDEHELGMIASVAADLGRALVVSRLLKQQEALVEQLRELDRTKSDFLSTVSHELRTPLTSIAGYLEMVREGDGGEVPPEMDAMLVVVERNAARLRSLIEDLLTLSRIESGTYRVTHEEVCLAETAAMVMQSMRPAAEKGKVTVALEVSQTDALVMGDPGQLERAVTNLVSNAVKFTPAGGWVRVATRVAQGRVVLEVADTGIGIPTDEQDQLFSRFFRASNATEQAIPGTGLGLTIVRSIIEHHGGELRLASVVGEGTTVTMDLPLLAGSRTAAATAAARASIAASVAAMAHHELAARAPATVGAR